jgi:hypothetical protein
MEDPETGIEAKRRSRQASFCFEDSVEIIQDSVDRVRCESG